MAAKSERTFLFRAFCLDPADEWLWQQQGKKKQARKLKAFLQPPQFATHQVLVDLSDFPHLPSYIRFSRRHEWRRFVHGGETPRAPKTRPREQYAHLAPAHLHTAVERAAEAI